MHYLRLALLAEGTSDHRFLPVILRRLAVDICANQAVRQVEVEDEVLDLTSLRMSDGEGNRLDLVKKTLKEAAGTFSILFVHADGGGNPFGVRETQYAPLAHWIQEEKKFEASRSVAVIPVREMEAWTLADGDALRSAFGTVLDDTELGLPGRPRDVERIVDPKRSLEDAYSRVLGRRRRRKERTVNFLNAIAEKVRLDRLRKVPAFQTLEHDLHEALSQLGYFR